MDGQRFDTATRLLAGGMRRRDALKTLAGLVVAGVATRAVVEEAKACLEDGQAVCNSKADCCAGLGCFKQLGFECAPCKAHNKLCKDSDECCGDLTCNNRNHCTKGEGGGKTKCEGKDCKKGKGKGKHDDTGGCALGGEC
jgi:hypothetical protein